VGLETKAGLPYAFSAPRTNAVLPAPISPVNSTMLPAGIRAQIFLASIAVSDSLFETNLCKFYNSGKEGIEIIQ
jgi:hypothetical protein